MPTMKINDLTMYYEIHGQGEPLVLIAGFSADHLTWALVVEALAQHYQVILLDNRGAGQTDIPEGAYSIDQMADDVMALCAQLGIHQAHFVGNSMGGFIVQAIARRYASQVKSAVIANSAMNAHGCFKLYLHANLALLEAKVPLIPTIKSTCAWLFSYEFISQPGQLEMLIQLRLSNPYPFTLTGYHGQLAALEAFNAQPWLQEIRVPTLVIGASQDIIFPPRLTQALHQHIPHAQYHEFEGSGHLPHVEDPERFVAVVQNFMKSA